MNRSGTEARRKGFFAALGRNQRIFFVSASLCLCGFLSNFPALGQGAEPKFSDAGPDAEGYGKSQGYPTGTMIGRPQQFLVGNLSRADRLPNRRVARGEAVWRFKRAEREVDVAFSRGGASFNSIDDYLARHPATGLLVVKDDTILLERYRYARTDSDRFASQSMAKTVLAMLVGIAAAEGKIPSIDAPAENHVSGLKGREYGRTPLRALLHMSSGVEFTEDYSGSDDITKLVRGLRETRPGGQAEVIAQFNRRVATPDTKFHYASVETEILGLALAQATGRPVAEYLSEKIWRPIGAEADAAWLVDNGGQEMAFCCLNATLRDFGRVGRLLAHDGAWEGKQIVPRQWVLDATAVRPQDKHLAPRTATRFFGYGYQTWLFPGGRRMFAFQGIHGQKIYVDPASKLVMVQTAARRKPSADPSDVETVGLWMALVEKVGQ
jgi:CubicO group peptidase (beta-lactamase class C family)